MKRLAPKTNLPVWPFRLNSTSRQADGLVSWWAAAAGPSGVGLHDMCGGSSGTIAGAVYKPTLLGNALYFDSNNDEVNCNAKPEHHSAALTITAWVNRTSTSTLDAILSRAFNNTGGYQEYSAVFLNNDNDIAFLYHTATNGAYHQYNSSGAAIGAGWQHIALSYTFGVGSSMSICQSGVLLGGSWVSGNGNSTQSASAGYPVCIGRQAINSEYPHWFGGHIYDVRYYNRALSAAEIRQQYDPATRWELYQPVRRTYAVVAAAATGMPMLTRSGLLNSPLFQGRLVQ